MTLSQHTGPPAPDAAAPVPVAIVLRDMGIPIAARVRTAGCGHCGAPVGEPCVAVGGVHLARYARAYARQLITAAETFAAIDAAGGPFTAATIIPDGAL